jgi:hypothetical protein
MQSYLPNKGGKVVCGCLDRQWNPRAPEEILVGDAPEVIRSAELLIHQGDPIPVFLKEARNRWVYRGDYGVSGWTRDARELRRKERESGRDGVVMAIQLEPVALDPTEANHTYLLTWNPIRKPRNWAEEAAMTAERIACLYWWSTGNRQNIQPGDRLFLLKQGKEPKGIMGSGKAVSDVYEDEHWDADATRGKTALYVEVEFDRILDPETEEILPLALLKEKLVEFRCWDTRGSGISLDGVAEELERLWRSHLTKLDYSDPYDEELAVCEGELEEALRSHRKREARLRSKKIAQVLRDKGKLECEVPGCGFDFLEVYGEIGRGFAHVHHLLPLDDPRRPSRTRLSDLAIVCPNCHAIVHRWGENRPLEDLIRRRRARLG